MMRSLSSGVAGLRTHQTKLDVIGNNIANVNTNGFKASRTTFSDVYYQNLAGANRASNISGGKNPTQIGYGSTVATIDVMNVATSMASTDRALDVFIGGDGFLVSKDASGKTQYSRLGNLAFDGEGNLVDGNGQFIQGFPTDADGNPIISADGTITAEQLTKIKCDPDILDRLTGISISKTGAIVGILPGDTIVKGNSILPPYLVQEKITVPPTSNLSGDINLMVGALPEVSDLQAGALAPLGVTGVEYGDMPLPAVGASHSYSIAYDYNSQKLTFKDDITKEEYIGYVKDGKVTLYNSSTKKTAMVLTLKPTGDVASGTPVGGMTDLKYQATVSDKGENIHKFPTSGPVVVPGDGQKLDLGGMIDAPIDLTNAPDGITPFFGSIGNVQPDESVMLNMGNIVIAKFRNPSGMSEAGASYFDATSNSGDPTFVKPSIEGTGGLTSGALEASNVDVAKEFTDMITTQRGFQANSRIITVSDEMLQELVNLKR